MAGATFTVGWIQFTVGGAGFTVEGAVFTVGGTGEDFVGGNLYFLSVSNDFSGKKNLT